MTKLFKLFSLLAVLASPLAAQDTLVTRCPVDSISPCVKVLVKAKPTPPPVVVDTPVTPPVVIPPATGPIDTTGFTRLAERDFSTLTASGWYGPFSAYTGAVTVNSASSPRSPSGVVTQTFNSRLSGGNSPGSLGTGIAPKKALYTAVWMLLSSNFVGHPGNVNKVIHFYINGGNRMIFLARGAGTGTLTPGFNTQGIAKPYTFVEGGMTITGSTEANLYPNVNPCVIQRGKWIKYEILLTANTPGVADGKAELWQDGVKCLDYTGIAYGAAGTASKWEEVNWSPTYGGGATTITTSFFAQMDHIYISGK